jgi:hypothetical protein
MLPAPHLLHLPPPPCLLTGTHTHSLSVSSTEQTCKKEIDVRPCKPFEVTTLWDLVPLSPPVQPSLSLFPRGCNELFPRSHSKCATSHGQTLHRLSPDPMHTHVPVPMWVLLLVAQSNAASSGKPSRPPQTFHLGSASLPWTQHQTDS